MDKPDFQKNIGHKVRLAHIAIDKYFNTCWENAGIEPTRMQCATMRYLHEHKGQDVFQKDLEEAFSITGATATNILKVMEKDGLITRVPMPHDARLKRVELTEKGWELDAKARDNVMRLEQGMREDFSEEELERFRAYLDRMTQNIVKMVEKNTK